MCVRRAKFRVAVVTLATARGPVRSERKSLTSERARGPVPAEVMIGLSGNATIGRLGKRVPSCGPRCPNRPGCPSCPIWVVDPASAETLGNHTGPDPPLKPNPPRKFPLRGIYERIVWRMGRCIIRLADRAPRCLTRSCRCTARAKETRQPSPPGPRSSRFFCVRLPLRRPATVLPGRPDYSGVVCGLRLTNQPVAYACRFAFSTPPNAGCLDRQAMLPVGVCLVHAPMVLPGGHGPRCVSPPALRGPVNRLSRRSSGIRIRPRSWPE